MFRTLPLNAVLKSNTTADPVPTGDGLTATVIETLVYTITTIINVNDTQAALAKAQADVQTLTKQLQDEQAIVAQSAEVQL